MIYKPNRISKMKDTKVNETSRIRKIKDNTSQNYQ